MTDVMAETERLESGWLQDTPVEDSILRRFLFNQAETGESIARAVGGRVVRTSGVSLVDCGAPVPYFNQATMLRPLAGLDDPVLDEVAAFYRDGSPGLLLSAWPTPELARRGWTLVGHPMFVARGPVAPAIPPPRERPGVSVRVARTADELAVVECIVVEGYPLPEMAGRGPNLIFGTGLVSGPIVHRIGYLDGTPVAAAASHVAHGVVNLCLAATLPAARRRGVWQALVDARCSDAPDLPAMAFTSDDSRPGFVRMGFLPVTRFTLWVVTS